MHTDTGQPIAPPAPGQKPRTPVWTGGPYKRALTMLAYPIFFMLNRPSLAWFARASYNFALRCNGVAINFPGSYGLTVGEERFVQIRLDGLGTGVLLDVGANNGTYSLHLRRVAPAATIYAFEPHPRTFAELRTRTDHDPAIHALNLGLSDHAGRMELHDFAGDDGSTQASLDVEAVRLFASETVAHKVIVATIDGFMAEHAIARINFLKIDTEGFDIAVLRGARAALAAGLIDAIQFEFIPANIARHVTMRDFFEVLEGYKIFRLCMNGSLLPLDPYDVKRCEIYVTQNLVALPR